MSDLFQSADGLPAAILFPGQGSQRKGMLKSLCEKHPELRDPVGSLLDLAGKEWISLLGSEEGLDWTTSRTAHLAIVVAGITSFRLLLQRDMLRPQFLAGHSLGELTALACANVLTDQQVIRLALARGEAMDLAAEKMPGGMMAVVGMEMKRVEEILDKMRDEEEARIWLANINAPNQIVVAGSPEALEKGKPKLEEQGGRVIPLATAGAFHTPLMRSAADRFAEALASETWGEPSIPVVSSRTGKRITTTASLRSALTLQMLQPVLWTDTMAFLKRAGVTRVVEMPPAGVLTNLAKRLEFQHILEMDTVFEKDVVN